MHILAPPYYVELPKAFVIFQARKIEISFDKAHEKHLQRTIEAVPYFPEIYEVFISYTDKHRYKDAMPCEEMTIPVSLLQALAKLPNLRTLTFSGGTFSDEAMAALASCHSLRTLNLGRCRVTKEGFSKLAALKNLEEFYVTSGLEPDCFVTLAKLPRFRGFCMSDMMDVMLGGVTQAFNRPIDEATRLAIASLDGRLEEFAAIGYEEDPIVHGTVLSALLKIKSLQVLVVPAIGPGFTSADAEEFKTMMNLHELCLPDDFSGMKADGLPRVQPIIDAAKARANANAQRLIDNRKASEKAGRKGS